MFIHPLRVINTLPHHVFLGRVPVQVLQHVQRLSLGGREAVVFRPELAHSKPCICCPEIYLNHLSPGQHDWSVEHIKHGESREIVPEFRDKLVHGVLHSVVIGAD